jgi:hypothetical protein
MRALDRVTDPPTLERMAADAGRYLHKQLQAASSFDRSGQFNSEARKKITSAYRPPKALEARAEVVAQQQAR